MSAPDAHIQEEMANPKASAVQGGGGGPMDLDAQVNMGKGLAAGTKGFDKEIINHGANGNLVDQMGQSPLTAAAGGKINAFEGLQTANCSPAVNGKMSPGNFNALSKEKGGQGIE